MIYKKIDCTSNELSLPLGKGGHIYHGDEDFKTNGAPSIPYLAAKFEKTYVNGISIGKPFILVVMKDGYEAHDGRLQLKYSPKISWGSYTNQEFFDEAFKILGINSGSPFVCYEIEVYDQDTLHFRCAYKEEEYQFKDKNEYYEFVNNAISNDQSIKPFVIHDSIIKFPIQTIFYGAPGTGKSNKIEECTNNDNRIRTTFHPDSDYSTFVGAYKPTMEETGVTVAGRKETRIAYKYVPQAFLKAYVNAWEKMNEGNDSPYYLEAVLISFDKFVKHDLDECNLYHSFCGFSKEFIIDGQPSEVFQP